VAQVTGEEQGRKPFYLGMSEAARAARIRRLRANLAKCSLCPRRCRVDRLAGEAGECGAADAVIVSSAGPHFGEESVLVGSGGSGTIFFVHCNLACVFCQNWPISRGVERGDRVSIAELASLMIRLQRQGCENINLVTPTPYLYQIAAAIDEAAAAGLRLPVVYNSSGYEAVASLKLLNGFIDIYMPDAKYSDDLAGELYSGVKGYYTHLQKALKEMQRQVGDLALDRRGTAYRGLLVRHLVMPGAVSGTAALARFLADEISPACAVNVMAQYYPTYRAGEFPAINRRITTAEHRSARELIRRAGLRLID
jgi:putative pyruvate formate lyase activating enzyme